MNEESSALLDGFEYVPTDGLPFITLDNQRRFYINATVRKLLGIKPYQRLVLMYRVHDRSLAVIKDNGVTPTSANANTASYFVDKRYYMSARKFSEQYAYGGEGAPYSFVYDRGSSDGSVFIFRLSDAQPT